VSSEVSVASVCTTLTNKKGSNFSLVKPTTYTMANATPAAAQPRFSLPLTPTADVCHLNGESRFGFKLKILSHEDEIITVCLHKTSLKEFHGLEQIACVTNEEGKEVEWPLVIGCWEHDDPFPGDYFFEEFRPGVPYERMFWLDKWDPATAREASLGTLKLGKSIRFSLVASYLKPFGSGGEG
jgi:hypothetical protein